MKAITLHQPWASLVALRIKTVETRSWGTGYSGPLAIHAAKRKARPEDMKRLVVDHPAAWDAWYQGGLVSPDGATDHMPYGAVVAVCRLVDCAPIGGPTSFRTGIVEGDEGDWYGRPVIVYHPTERAAGLGDYLALDLPGRPGRDITGQLPFGDYGDGRWGWLLEDIEPVGPIPATGRQRLWEWDLTPPPVLTAAD